MSRKNIVISSLATLKYEQDGTISNELDCILESILIDSEFDDRYTTLVSQIYVDPVRTPGHLLTIMLDLENKIDYTTDGGERPFPGASSLIREIEHYLRKGEK